MKTMPLGHKVLWADSNILQGVTAPQIPAGTALARLGACLKIRTQRRVRARGLQVTPKIPIPCRPGAPTGRIFRQALKLGGTAVDGAWAPMLFLANKVAAGWFGSVRPRPRGTGQTKIDGAAMGLNYSVDSLQHYSLFELFGFLAGGDFCLTRLDGYIRVFPSGADSGSRWEMTLFAEIQPRLDGNGTTKERLALRSGLPCRPRAQARQFHQFGCLSIGFFHPGDDLGVVGRVFQLDGDDAVDFQLLDGLQVGRELDNAAAGRQIAMHLAVAIAQMNVDGFALELLHLGGAGVGQDQVADVDVGPDARMAALIDETDHAGNAVQEAEAERLQFEGNVDAAFVGVIAQTAAGFQAPIPLRLGRDDFALPDIFAQDDEDVFRAPSFGQIDVLAAAGQVELAHRLVEIDHSHRDDRQRDDGQAEPGRNAADETDFALGEAGGLGENIDAIETDAGDVFKAHRGIDAGLGEGAVDDAKSHKRTF